MSMTLLTEHELRRLRQLGDVLIPGNETMPVFSTVPGIDGLLRTATGALGREETTVRSAIAAIPEFKDLRGAKAFSESEREVFELLALVVSSAYYMAHEVLVALGYPTERRNPAGVGDFADEYMTGIVDPVVENRRGAS